MTTIIVRVKFQTPAADHGNGRMRGSWGVTPRIRFMRAQLYAARICDWCRSFKASGGLIFNALLQACKHTKRDSADLLETLSVAAVVHADNHAAEGLPHDGKTGARPGNLTARGGKYEG